MRSVRIWLLIGASALAGLGGGVLLGSGDDPDPTVPSEVPDLRARVDRLTTERDRLRQERDQLEARLAAEEAPAVCPSEYVSTGQLLPHFSIDHRCGWHVLYDPSSPVSAEERAGLRAEAVIFGRLPISLAPTEGPIGEFELTDWTDDPADDDDMLPPLATWLREERERYISLSRDDRFESGDGITVYRLVGMQELFDEPVEVHTMFWRYDDTVAGARHIMRAFALAPSARTVDAFDRMARSFRAR